MATIRKRVSERTGKVAYSVQVRAQGFPAQSATFDRLTDAKAWAAKTESDLRSGKLSGSRAAKKITLSDAIDRYLLEILPTKKDQKMPTERLRYWRKTMGGLALADITPLAIQSAKAELVSGVIEGQRNNGKQRSAATVNRYLAALSALLTACVEWHTLDENPCRKIKRQKEAGGRTRFLSPEEEGRLLEECQASTNEALFLTVLLSLRTGARSSEVLGLQWENVFLEADDEPFLLFRDTKNGTDRAVPLVKDAEAELRAWRRARWGSNGDPSGKRAAGLVFPSKKDPDKPLRVTEAFLCAVKRAGIEGFTWHDMRHTVGSNLAMSGAGLVDLMTVLGHKSPAMSKRYTHLTMKHTAGVMSRAFDGKTDKEAGGSGDE